MTKATLLLSILFTFVSFASAGDTLYGTIVEVKSGDVAVLDYGQGKYTIRLVGLKIAGDKALAKRAKQTVASMILNKRVQLRFAFKNDKDEMVSRILTIYTDKEKGEDIGEKLVSAGLAQKQADYDYPCGCLAKAEKEA